MSSSAGTVARRVGWVWLRRAAISAACSGVTVIQGSPAVRSPPRIVPGRQRQAVIDRPGDVQNPAPGLPDGRRSDEHTSELQSVMRISYAVFCVEKNKHEYTRLRFVSHVLPVYRRRAPPL